MILSRDNIKSAIDLETKEVFIEPWKGSVIIRAMTVKDELDLEELLKDKNNEKDLPFHFIKMSCIDEEGGRLFDDNDIEMLKSKSSDSITTLYTAILELNKKTENQTTELAKN